MIALAVSIGLLVIFLTMYTTVLERTRDIGVLKSLGASKVLIVRALLTETALLCAPRYCRRRRTELPCPRRVSRYFPNAFDFDYRRMDYPGRACIALVGRVFGASYPAWVASRKDAVEALSYD